MTGSTPASATRLTARCTSVSPSSSTNSLLRPIRVDVPAASTMPATRSTSSGDMDGGSSFTKMTGLLARVDGQQFGQDADGDLLGAVGPHIKADRAEHSISGSGAHSLKYLFCSGARSQETNVSGLRL